MSILSSALFDISTEVSSEAFNVVVTLAQEHKNSSSRFTGPTSLVPKGSASPRQAFDEVVPVAQDCASRSGLLNGTDYSKMPNRGGKATHTRNTFKQAPTPSDFVCDVEITARKTLTNTEFIYFKRYYLEECLAIADKHDNRDWYMNADKYLLAHLLRFPESKREWIATMDHNIRVKLGARFVEVGLHPCNGTEGYFSDADIRMKLEKQDAD